jgi:hypothetical protein
MRFEHALAVAAATALLGACAIGDDRRPARLVRDLYSEPGPVLQPAAYQDYFAQDLAAALATNGGGADLANFDYRYDGQEAGTRRLYLHNAVGIGMARVTARFDSSGEREAVVWRLCQRPDGAWRIADAGSGDDTPWTLRNLLRQPAEAAC